MLRKLRLLVCRAAPGQILATSRSCQEHALLLFMTVVINEIMLLVITTSLQGFKSWKAMHDSV